MACRAASWISQICSVVPGSCILGANFSRRSSSTRTCPNKASAKGCVCLQESAAQPATSAKEPSSARTVCSSSQLLRSPERVDTGSKSSQGLAAPPITGASKWGISQGLAWKLQGISTGLAWGKSLVGAELMGDLPEVGAPSSREGEPGGETFPPEALLFGRRAPRLEVFCLGLLLSDFSLGCLGLLRSSSLALSGRLALLC
mmetsp:Transcript_4775/g.8475  ORF Transcript_4775/g.8475 Transcript_4775/m.8475 type:complete len:202 (+) Transcript_4775:486-1091(+)